MGMKSFENVSSQETNEKVYKIGEKEYHAGEKVIVVRSDGTLEQDWELKSVGGKFAVAEKVDTNEGVTLQKVIPIEEFQDAQMLSEKIDAKSREFISPSGKEYNISPETMANKFGIDTKGKTLEQINAEVQKKIREITGV